MLTAKITSLLHWTWKLSLPEDSETTLQQTTSNLNVDFWTSTDTMNWKEKVDRGENGETGVKVVQWAVLSVGFRSVHFPASAVCCEHFIHQRENRLHERRNCMYMPQSNWLFYTTGQDARAAGSQRWHFFEWRPTFLLQWWPGSAQYGTLARAFFFFCLFVLGGVLVLCKKKLEKVCMNWALVWKKTRNAW